MSEVSAEERASTLRAALRPLAPRARFLAALAAWALLVSSQPGIGREAGFGHTGFVALAPWAYFCARPGRRAFLMEWLAASLGLAAMCWWMRHLLPWLVPILGLVPGLYVALGGMALRRMARRFPLAFAAPAAWMLGELLRWFLPSPASFGWWRLGMFGHDSAWIAGSARVWGTWGLTWVFAAFAGWLADLWRTRRLRLDQEPAFPMARVHLLGLGPLVVGMALTIAVPAPRTVDGPRVLLVQPGIEQELKAQGTDWLRDLYGDALALTLEGLAGPEPAPDLVCWGETMFPVPLVQPGLAERVAGGLQRIAIARPTEAGEVREFEGLVAVLVDDVLFGRRRPPARLLDDLPLAPADRARALRGERLLPAGTAFVAGAIEWLEAGGYVRSRNAVALWGADGTLVGTAAKHHLVPVAESSDLYAAVPFVVKLVTSVGGFVPDFLPSERPETLALGAHRFGALVCYDNVFDGPFREPLARGEPVAFHLVVSNEAWYRESVEMDHMVAFSRLQALATGRSVVRATNSGRSIVLDPSGRRVGGVRDAEGREKMARGTASVVVPVPEDPAARTVWVRTGGWQPFLWVLLVAVGLVLSGPAVTGDLAVGNGGTGEASGRSRHA